MEWIAPLVTALVTLSIGTMTFLGNRRAGAVDREHRMMDRLAEERDHWQRRAEAAEQLARDNGWIP